MKLSVVVPFYNVELYIHDCLASIARQSMSDFEVLLVDDGSPDGSRAIAEEYAERDSRFRIITQENQGLGPARNTGMRHATGDYLTFVDSDDIIPKQAFDLMVGRLDAQGADLAAGMAKRFNIHGSRDSWLHAGLFAEDRSRTSVRAFHELANDRMVWNKVYRRSFWEAGGYEFPPIMYEDYPVTLRAHLTATQVEVVSTPIYMWRERDAGESSITQRVYEARNIRDRVTSALMVFDVLRTAPPEIAHVVQRHLASTDFSSIARAVALSVDTPDLAEVMADAQRFTGGLDPDVIRGRGPLDRVLFQLLQQGRADEVAEVIGIRDELRPPARHELTGDGRNQERHVSLAGSDLAVVPADWRLLRDEELDLTGRVTELAWDTDQPQVLRLQVLAWIHFSGDLGIPIVTAWLRSRRGEGDLPVPVVAVTAAERHKVLVTVEVDASALAAGTRDTSETHPWTLWLEMSSGSLVRSGPVRGVAPDTATATPPWQADEWTWVQPGQHRSRYVVNVVRRNVVIDDFSTRNRGELTVRGRSRTPLTRDVMVRAAIDGQPDVMLYPARVEGDHGLAWSAHLQLAPLVAEDMRDPLVDMVREWQLSLVDTLSQETPTMSPELADARVLVGDQEVQLVSNRFHAARIDVANPEFAIESTSMTAPGLVTFHGRWLDGSGAGDDLLLQWYRDLDTPQEIRIPTRYGEGWLEFDVDLAQLAAVTDAALADDALDPRAHWDASLWHDGDHVTVHTTPTVERHLVEVRHHDEHGRVSVGTHRRRALRFTVRPPD